MATTSQCKFVASHQRLPLHWGQASSNAPLISGLHDVPGKKVLAQRSPLAPFASLSLHALGHGKEPAPAYAHDMKLLCGTWVKDKAVSDPMGPAMDLMQLGGIVRQAVKLIRGIKIEQDDTTWSMAVFSVISWFKVTERYKLNGEPAKFKRRDLRKGGHVGQLKPGQPGPHGGLVLSLTWGPPHGGEGTDEFVLAPRGTAAAQLGLSGEAKQGPPGEQELHVYSKMLVGGTPSGYRTVYHKK